MSTLEELLRKTLDGGRPAFDQADRDLHEAVREASDAAENITRGLATLRLVRYEDFARDTVYQFVIKIGDEKHELGAFAIPHEGYPIRFSNSVGEVLGSGPNEAIQNRDELRHVFEKMATDKRSRLVASLAYIVRNHEALSDAKTMSGFPE